MSILPLHDSIYRALTNPELDRPISSVVSTPVLETSVSNINNSPISILSSSQEDDNNDAEEINDEVSSFSMVGAEGGDYQDLMIDSNMEEGEEGKEEVEGTRDKKISSFIMPRVISNSNSVVSKANSAHLLKQERMANKKIKIQIVGDKMNHLIHRFNHYKRILNHCIFYTNERSDTDIIILIIDLNEHDEEEGGKEQMMKSIGKIDKPFIPILINGKEGQSVHLQLKGRVICDPIEIKQWPVLGIGNDLMILIDFLINLKRNNINGNSSRSLSLPKINKRKGLNKSLNDINSILIESININSKNSGIREKLIMGNYNDIDNDNDNDNDNNNNKRKKNNYIKIIYYCCYICCCFYCCYNIYKYIK